MDETKRLSEWIKRHKKELIIAGVSSAAIVALIFGYRNQDHLSGIKNSLDHLFFKRAQDLDLPKVQETINQFALVEKMSGKQESRGGSGFEMISSDVRSHVRNLHEGWKASPEKIALAAENGYDLKPGQTWVKKYTKGDLVA